MDHTKNRHKNEVLTDNTQEIFCKQCKTCRHKIGKTVWSNRYYKCCCSVYEYPIYKPNVVIDNLEECQFYQKEK